MLRHGRRYDVVHVSNFPHFSLIGARLGSLPHRHLKVVGDWHEVWTRSYWQTYLAGLLLSRGRTDSAMGG